MSAVIEQALTRGVSRADERSWLRWGMAVFVSLESIHLIGGLLLNDWEGWGTFFGNLSFIVVTGVVIVGLTFGLLVRWGLKTSPAGRNRTAMASLAAGIISVVSYLIFFTWAPVLVAPAAVLLGRQGLIRPPEAGGRAIATVGALLGLASLAYWAFLLGYGLTHQGNFPWPFGE